MRNILPVTATGNGQILTGAEDSSVEGLMIRYEGADTGIVGEMLFSRGVASAVESAADRILGSGEGSIDGIIAKYPTKASALMPCLWVIMDEIGWVPPGGIDLLVNNAGVQLFDRDALDEQVQ